MYSVRENIIHGKKQSGHARLGENPVLVKQCKIKEKNIKRGCIALFHCTAALIRIQGVYYVD